MQILSAKETKETALNKKRNLFGLGVTSLIAACGGAAESGPVVLGGPGGEGAEGGQGGEGAEGGQGEEGGPGGEGEEGGQGEEENPVILPFKAEELSEADGYSTTKVADADSVTVKVEKAGTTQATLSFSNANDDLTNAVKIHQLTPTENQYDLVISVPTIDKINDNNNNPEHRKGRIFIYWDVKTVTNESSPDLEIKGATKLDRIGNDAPDFLQLGGTDNKYDMVIRSEWLDKSGTGNRYTNEGVIYILWDIVDYSGGSKTIDLGSLAADITDSNNVITSTAASSGSLAIYGAIKYGQIGGHVLDFSQIGGKDNNYDIIIRSERLDKAGGSTDEGAIYILWDVVDYYGTQGSPNNRVIDLGAAATDTDNYATAGLLTIYGASPSDYIGTFAPDFLQIGGGTGDDMIIRSEYIDKPDMNKGAIYILWDVADYAGKNKTIDLGSLGDTDGADVLGFGATAGSLAIYGAKARDYIGTFAPDFLQIGGKEGDNKLDMVIRSHVVDSGSVGAVGAIYVLWDVADYAGGNEVINLASLSADATFGLLTIYGKSVNSNLGSKDNNILYRADSKDSDVDGDGKNDLVFKDVSHTYVLFGDKVVTITGAGDNTKVASKTIDLAQVSANGYFGSGSVDDVGYRFAGSKTFEEVKAQFSSGLSDADAGVGVWDIA